MKEMTAEKIQAFLMEGTRTGKLATVRADGRPHLAPVWFLLDGDALVFTTWHQSIKAKNMLWESRVSLCVDEETPPYAFVLVEGTVSIEEADAEKRYAWARRIAARYMGEELAEQYGKRNSVPGEWVVRLTPTKIIAQKDVAGFG